VNVLFVCVGNSGRSVISERLFEREAGGRHHAQSAGSMPGTRADRGVIEALRELGVDASDHVPQKLNQDLINWANVVVATCDDSCPYVPGKRYVNWHLPDPHGQPLERVRDIRDDIAGRIAALVREIDAAGVTA
jgi:arsenate reductase